MYLLTGSRLTAWNTCTHVATSIVISNQLTSALLCAETVSSSLTLVSHGNTGVGGIPMEMVSFLGISDFQASGPTKAQVSLLIWSGTGKPTQLPKALSRRDDLKSIAYIFLYLLHLLPWATAEFDILEFCAFSALDRGTTLHFRIYLIR